jgi:hypothetical protein
MDVDFLQNICIKNKFWIVDFWAMMPCGLVGDNVSVERSFLEVGDGRLLGNFPTYKTTQRRNLEAHSHTLIAVEMSNLVLYRWWWLFL